MTYISDEYKFWIDNATYTQLLQRWRFAATGDTIFAGNTGDYYRKVMTQKKAELTHDEQVRVSKSVGW